MSHIILNNKAVGYIDDPNLDSDKVFIMFGLSGEKVQAKISSSGEWHGSKGREARIVCCSAEIDSALVFVLPERRQDQGRLGSRENRSERKQSESYCQILSEIDELAREASRHESKIIHGLYAQLSISQSTDMKRDEFRLYIEKNIWVRSTLAQVDMTFFSKAVNLRDDIIKLVPPKLI